MLYKAFDNSCGINITDTGITYMEPSGFGTTMTESFAPFDSIAAVSTVVPLVGFSSIIITLKGQGRIIVAINLRIARFVYTCYNTVKSF
jgi:hypothetical protein